MPIGLWFVGQQHLPCERNGEIDGHHGAQDGDGQNGVDEELSAPNSIISSLWDHPGGKQPKQADDNRYSQVTVTGVSAQGQRHGRRRKRQHMGDDVFPGRRNSPSDRQYGNICAFVIRQPENGDGVTVGYLPQTENE